MSTPATPSDPRTRRGRLSTGTFSYTDEGDPKGRVVLAVPGYPGGTRDYRWLAPALLTPDCGLRLLRIDMPGFGDTPLATAPAVDIPGRATFVAEILERLDLDNVLLIGHSMGGALAGTAASLVPDRVSALGLLASLGPVAHPTVDHGRPARIMGLIDGRWTGRLTRPTLPWMFERMGFPRRWDPDQLAHTLRCAAALDFPEWAQTVKALQLPTLVAWATDDPLIPPALSQALADAAPAGPRLTWPTGGHNIQKSHAVELGKALRELAATTTAPAEAATLRPQETP